MTSRRKYMGSDIDMVLSEELAVDKFCASRGVSPRTAYVWCLERCRSEEERDKVKKWMEEYFSKEANAGLQYRFKDRDIPVEYQQRLDTELAVIASMGFAGYFLIVADFIHWAQQHNIPVGPGRGSGVGSLVVCASNAKKKSFVTSTKKL